MAKKLLLVAGFMLATYPVQAAQNVEKGKSLYINHCAPCHGLDGSGNGEAGAHLSPPPADLREALQNSIISDEYLMWTIREGGQNVHTQMPAFETEGTIDGNDAKDIIHYLWQAFK
ncbi:MAG: cytochrome c [Methylocystaceae bacterium]|nr:cytochrome c [Methylocystaceae bacterium]